MKWTEEEKVKLFKLVLASNPEIKINYGAVAAAWPAEVDGEKPTAEAVKKTFNTLKQSARDLVNLQAVKAESAGKSTPKADAKIINNKIITPITPKTKFTAVKKESMGSKRKRRGAVESSDEGVGTDAETSSGSDAVFSPTPATRRTLRVRKTLPVAPATPEESDKQVDAGAKDYGSGQSDEDYDFAEERGKKAVKKAKEAKLAARRARSQSK